MALATTQRTGLAQTLRNSLWNSALALFVPNRLLVFITLLGGLLRLYRLDARSLWTDEIITAHVRTFGPLQDVLDYTLSRPSQLPFIDVLTWLLRWLGYGEVGLRLPMAIAGTLTIPVVYQLGKSLFGVPVGLLAAVLTAVMPFHVWYAQEARVYAFLLLGTTLVMLSAHAVVTREGAGPRLALLGATIATLQTHYLALLPVAAAYGFLGLVICGETWVILRAQAVGDPGRRAAWLRLGRRTGSIVAIGLISLLSYLPLLPYVRSFRSRPDTAFERVSDAPSVADALRSLQWQLGDFDLQGVALWLLVVGLIGAAGVLRRHSLGALLLLCWIVLPLLVLGAKLRLGLFLLQPRYLCFLGPGIALGIALGVATSAGMAGALAERSGRVARRLASPGRVGVRRLVWALLVALLLGQGSVALAQSYERPKQDFRAAARMLMRDLPADGVVLAMGSESNMVTAGLSYYLNAYGASIAVFDTQHPTDALGQELARYRGPVYAAFAHLDSRNSPAPLANATFEVIPFFQVSLARPQYTGESALAQATRLLRWGSVLQPSAEAAANLLDVQTGKLSLGENILPPLALRSTGAVANQWVFPDGTALDQEGITSVAPQGAMLNVTLTTDRAEPEQTYGLRFRYRNAELVGEQRVYVTAHDRAGALVSTFPSGAGYPCEKAADWTEGFFTLTLPPEVVSLTIWLRATGTGEAEFDAVELRAIQ